MSEPRALAPILDELAVPHDCIVYVHSSADWLGRAGVTLQDAYETLLEWIAPGGTLVMPAFPFRGSHEDYLRSGALFDVRRTPARVGLLNETLRRRPGARRSLDPDLSVVAFGPQANAICGSGLTGVDPMGADSPFQRVLDRGGVFLGLGVSFNYMSLIHVLDARYRHRYPFAIYSDILYTARARDEDGREHAVPRHAFLDAVPVHIKPAEVVRRLRPAGDVFRSVRRGETEFFVWDLPRWEALCVGHIEAALDAGDVPCWFADALPQLPRRDPIAQGGHA